METLALHAGPGPWFGLVWLVLVVGLVGLLWFRARRCGPGWRGRGAAEAVLAERFASGQLTEDEYRRAQTVLRDREA